MSPPRSAGLRRPALGPAGVVARVRDGRTDLTPFGAGAGMLIVAGALVLALNGSYDGLIFETALGYAVVTVGMVVQLGYSHQLAFSQSAFMGLGAYSVALLETRYGFSSPEAILAALGLAAIAAALVGSVVTRAPGLALALATLLLPVMLYELATISNYLGSFTGVTGVLPIWSGASYESGLVRSGVIAAAILAAVIAGAYRVLRSGIGLELSALASSEALAAGIGVSLRQRKLELFVVGSVLAALGGAIVASIQAIVSPDIIAETTELTLLIMLFIGGRRNILAAAVGAIGVEYLSTVSSTISTNMLVIEGVALLAVLLFEPEGIAGLFGRAARALPWWRAATAAGIERRARTLDGASSGVPLDRSSQEAGEDAGAGAPGPGTSGLAVGHLVRRRPPTASSGAAVLECAELTKHFGGIVAVDHVSFAISSTGLYGLLGPNGAGKTTLFNLLAGAAHTGSGTVHLRGEDVSRLGAAPRARLGMARTWQSVQLIPDRTVLDNVALSCIPSHGRLLTAALLRSELREARERAHATLQQLGLSHMASQRAEHVTLEGQRMIELARAVASDPVVVLADEPASGLSSSQRMVLSELLVTIAADRVVLMVEHDVDLVERISSRVLLMLEGRLVFDGPVEEFRSAPERTIIRGVAVTTP